MRKIWSDEIGKTRLAPSPSCFKVLLNPLMKGHTAMKLTSANIQDLRTLYIENLKKTLDMEQKITKALPDLIEKSTDSE